MILASEMVLPLSITAILTTSGFHDSRHAKQVDTLLYIFIYLFIYLFFFASRGQMLYFAADLEHPVLILARNASYESLPQLVEYVKKIQAALR